MSLVVLIVTLLVGTGFGSSAPAAGSPADGACREVLAEHLCEQVDRPCRSVLAERWCASVDPARHHVADLLINEQKLMADEAAEDDYFGFAVAAAEGRIVIGAHRHDSAAGTDTGAAYLIERDLVGTYTQTLLTASDGAPFDRFGLSVDIDGDRVLVGAADHDGRGVNAGAAYLFEFNEEGAFTETKFTASDAQAGDGFGWSVAIDGDTLLVGAPHKDIHGTDSGAAYRLQPDGNGGYIETRITPHDGAAYDRFGKIVALDGEDMLIGAPHDGALGSAVGAAYLYRPDDNGNTLRETRLTAADGRPGDAFGISLALRDGLALVGAYTQDSTGPQAGAAYLFEYDPEGKISHTKLVPADLQAGAAFGIWVAIDHDRLVVGAYTDDHAGSHTGAAYLFEQDGTGAWRSLRLTASDAETGAEFGRSVAIDGANVYVGAFLDDEAGANAGAVYRYDLSNPVREILA